MTPVQRSLRLFVLSGGNLLLCDPPVKHVWTWSLVCVAASTAATLVACTPPYCRPSPEPTAPPQYCAPPTSEPAPTRPGPVTSDAAAALAAPAGTATSVALVGVYTWHVPSVAITVEFFKDGKLVETTRIRRPPAYELTPTIGSWVASGNGFLVTRTRWTETGERVEFSAQVQVTGDGSIEWPIGPSHPHWPRSPLKSVRLAPED